MYDLADLRICGDAFERPRSHRETNAMLSTLQIKSRYLALCMLGFALLFPVNGSARSYAVLYSFEGGPSDGAYPLAGVLADRSGNLYGATSAGGGTGCFAGCGTIYELKSGGKEKLLYSFGKASHAARVVRDALTPFVPSKHCSKFCFAGPNAGLLLRKNILYGTVCGPKCQGFAPNGKCSKNSCGGAFALQNEKISFHLFKGKDGSRPTSFLIFLQGSLYGTTSTGGANDSGTVFKLTRSGKETLLYSFAGGSDGAYPVAGLVADQNDNLYGTTEIGGSACSSRGGCGVVFKVAPDGTEAVLHAFAGGKDGAQPAAGLIFDGAGNLYGTTTQGGGACSKPHGCGTVFKLSPDRTVTVLHAFAGGDDGDDPTAGLILDKDGNFYGTTLQGGIGCGCGTVFKLSPDGSIKVLRAFADGNDGGFPYAGLIAQNGKLYGTTVYGGAAGFGTIFAISK
jgi:uncharacterized repeat protein (TIGR03803 family)